MNLKVRRPQPVRARREPPRTGAPALTHPNPHFKCPLVSEEIDLSSFHLFVIDGELFHALLGGLVPTYPVF
jgi:hypothetical protein